MSITSDSIREHEFIHAFADDAADEIEALELENGKLRALIELIFASTLPYNDGEATFSDKVTDIWAKLQHGSATEDLQK